MSPGRGGGDNGYPGPFPGIPEDADLAEPPPMPIFILEHTENKTSKQLAIDGDRILIGRSPSAEIPLADTGVSKQHLIIERAAGGYTFRDLGSQNGTYVNELRREEGALRDGDVIRIGRIRITFRLEPPSAPAAAAAPSAAAPEPAAASAGPAAGAAAPAPAASGAAAPGAAEEGKPEPFDLDGLPVARLAEETEKFPRISAPAPDRRAERTPSRFHPAAVWSLIAVIGVGVGLALGILGSYLEKGSDPAGAASARRAGGTPGASPADPGGAPAAEDYAPAAGEVAPPPAGLAGFPGLAPDPLGGYASAAESARTLHRLHVDLLGRPPTRAEFRAALPLAHLERWNRLRPGGAGPARGMADLRAAFLSLLDREPSRQELDYLDAHPGPIEDLGLWLTATVEYRSAEHRRDRSLRERARSLIVDLLDRAPESPEEITAVEEAILELHGLAEIARTLAAAGAPAAPVEDLEGWIVDEIFRFLQRPPRAGEVARLAEEMKKSPQAQRWLLQTLAQANEYRRY